MHADMEKNGTLDKTQNLWEGRSHAHSLDRRNWLVIAAFLVFIVIKPAFRGCEFNPEKYDYEDLFLSFAFFLVFLAFLIYRILPKTYILTPTHLLIRIGKRLPETRKIALENVRNVQVVQTSHEVQQGTKTLILRTTEPGIMDLLRVFSRSSRSVQGKVVLYSIFDADHVVELIEKTARQRREELRNRKSGHDLPADSKIIKKELGSEIVLEIPVEDQWFLSWFFAAFCLTALSVGLIYVLATTLARETLTIIAAGTSALAAAFCWVQMKRYGDPRLRLVLGQGTITLQRVPSIISRTKVYDAAEVRNLRAVGPTGTLSKGYQLVDRFESSEGLPLFPEFYSQEGEYARLAFDYDSETVIFCGDAKIGADEMAYLLYELAKHVGPGETAHEEERWPEPCRGGGLEVIDMDYATVVKVGPPRRPLPGIICALSILISGLVALELILIMFDILKADYQSKDFLILATVLVICVVVGGAAPWFLIAEFFGTQTIEISERGISLSSNLWPPKRKKIIDISDIETVWIEQSRIYFSLPVKAGDFSIGRVPENKLYNLADIIINTLSLNRDEQ